ncbi:MAG TPA: helix-turn-helix domain-containing protein [Gemmatimonadales bacterium]|nr:helix-turn-helix domain-containing protein [Gemmatimonadales bacterium]
MPVVAAIVGAGEAAQALRRSLPPGGPWNLVTCRDAAALHRTLESRLVDAVVFNPTLLPPHGLETLAARFPGIPRVVLAPFKPDDGQLLLDCRAVGIAQVLVLGVDNAVAGELVIRVSAAAERRRALAEAVRVLRLKEPLQRDVWSDLLDRVDRPIRTAELAKRAGCTREHLSREFAAGGAPNLKRVIDLTRVACAAAMLRNPGYEVATVASILRFATPSHLNATARRIAGVSSRGLAGLGPKGVLANFARGKTRSRV